jgi:hypothetical protein
LGLVAAKALPGSRAAERDIDSSVGGMDGYTFLFFTLRPIRHRDKDAWWFCRREYGRRILMPHGTGSSRNLDLVYMRIIEYDFLLHATPDPPGKQGSPGAGAGAPTGRAATSKPPLSCQRIGCSVRIREGALVYPPVTRLGFLPAALDLGGA